MSIAVIVTDLRLPLLLAAYQIYKDFESPVILIHENHIKNNDYGNNSPIWYNELKVFILKFVANVSIIKSFGDLDETLNLGVMSSLISITNDSSASPDKYPKLFIKLKKMSSGAVSIGNYIRDGSYHKAVIFNGRLASVYPIVKACEKMWVDILYYEYGTIPFHYTLTDRRIHDMRSKAYDVIELFENPSISPAAFNVVNSSEKNVEKKMRNKFSQLYEKSDEFNYDFCLFLSSPHEFLALENSEIDNNLSYVLSVSKLQRRGRGAVRAHPNQVNDPSWRVESEQIQKICDEFGYDYYPPDDRVDSYALIRGARIVYVAMSSIALDAAILGARVEFLSDSVFRIFLDYVYSKNFDGKSSRVIAQLFELMSYVWQAPYHPTYSIILKLIHAIDVAITRPPTVGSAIVKKPPSFNRRFREN